MVVLVVGATWAFLASRSSSGARLGSATGPGTPVAMDRPAPPLSGSLLSGSGTIGPSAYRGSVLVVNFWASWCRACRIEAPRLEALWRSYASRGVRFIGVDYQDGRAAARSFARSFHMSFPSVIDANGKIADDFGIFGLPTTFIIGPDLRIRFQVTGKISTGSFSSALDAVLGNSSRKASAS